ncbi:MAG: calcium-binding protein [Pseudomonadota bacterium]
MIDVENVIGTSQADALVGDSLANQLIGRGGNDTLDGGSGFDTIDGGAGNDSLLGGFSDDTILGGAGNDTLDGGSGNDSLDGGAGSDSIIGGSGTDFVSYADLAIGRIIADLSLGTVSITGGQGVDTLVGVEVVTGTDRSDSIIWDETNGTTSTRFVFNGGLGADTLTGSRGADTLDGGVGNDSMTGGFGNDTYFVDRAADVVVELASQGFDLVNSAINYTLDANLENLTLIGNAVLGTGNSFNNVLIGNDRNNVLSGLDGRDTFTGGLGQDTLDAGLADLDRDIFVYNTVADSAAGAADVIRNFEVGTDDINLFNVDGNSLTAGLQRFTSIGDQSFSGVAGQLRVTDNGTDTFLFGDTDGDRVADFEIRVEGAIGLTNIDILV